MLFTTDRLDRGPHTRHIDGMDTQMEVPSTRLNVGLKIINMDIKRVDLFIIFFGSLEKIRAKRCMSGPVGVGIKAGFFVENLISTLKNNGGLYVIPPANIPSAVCSAKSGVSRIICAAMTAFLKLTGNLIRIFLKICLSVHTGLNASSTSELLICFRH